MIKINNFIRLLLLLAPAIFSIIFVSTIITNFINIYSEATESTSNTIELYKNIYNNDNMYNLLLSKQSKTYTNLKTDDYYGKINHIFNVKALNTSTIQTTILVTDFCTITVENSPVKYMTINPLPGFESSVLPKLLYKSIKKHYKINYSYNIRTYNNKIYN